MTLDEFAPRFLQWSRDHKRSHKRDEGLVRNLCAHFGPAPLDEIEESPLKGRLRLLAEPDGRLTVLTAQETGRLLAACPDGIKPIVILLVATGMRWGEVRGLSWAEVDLRRGAIDLPGARTKNSRPRTVPLNVVALGVLREAFADRGEDDGLVFPGRFGGPRRSILGEFRKALKTAKLDPGITVHDLRHVAASAAASRGVPIQVIGELLGHRTPSMTARYAHLLPEATKAGVEEIGAFLTGKDRPEKGAKVVRLNPASEDETSVTGQR
jgi:integrase